MIELSSEVQATVSRYRHRCCCAFLLVTCAGSIVSPSFLYAQTTPGSDAKPTGTAVVPPDTGDIVVTANRRSESIQRVGISITAATGDKLESLNIVRPEMLSKITPGLTAIPNAGSSVTSFNIRGIGQADFSEHEEQPVAVYQDGVYISSAGAAGFPIFDVQRVEILRGPQGTLFGRNSTGGLIQFISNQPQAGTSGAIEGTYGSYDLNRVQGFLNSGNDRIAARLGFYYSDRNGFIKNLAGKDLLSQRDFALRGQVKVALGETTQLTVRAEGFNQDGTTEGGKATPSYVDAHGVSQLIPLDLNVYGTGPGKDFFGYRDPNPDPLVRSVNDSGSLIKRSRTVAATLSHDFGDDISLYSISSFGHVKIRYREDTDGTPLLETRFGTQADSDTYTQELRVEKGIGRFRWTGGLYFLDINGKYQTFFDLPTLYGRNLNIPNGAKNTVDYSLHTRSFAPFAQLEYDLTEKLSLIGGARYNWDNQHFDYISQCAETIAGACAALFGTGSRPDIVSSLGLLHLKQKTADWNGKVQLNFKATPKILVYASASKGLKGAGFSAASDGFVLLPQLYFKPEKLYAFEMGVKSSFLDHRVTLNAGAFYYDYHDFQSFEFSGVSTSVVNRNAFGKGGEVELTLRPMQGLTGNLGVGYSDLQVKHVPTPQVPEGEDQQATNAPKWLLNWGITKSFQVTSDLALELTYNGRYTSSRYFSVVNEPIVRTPAFTLHDAVIKLDSKHGWSVGAFANNFTNNVYANVRFDTTSLGYALSHYGEPRVVGVTAGFTF